MTPFIEAIVACNPSMPITQEELDIINLEKLLECKKMLLRFKQRKKVVENWLQYPHTSPVPHFVALATDNQINVLINILEYRLKHYKPL